MNTIPPSSPRGSGGGVSCGCPQLLGQSLRPSSLPAMSAVSLLADARRLNLDQTSAVVSWMCSPQLVAGGSTTLAVKCQGWELPPPLRPALPGCCLVCQVLVGAP